VYREKTVLAGRAQSTDSATAHSRNAPVKLSTVARTQAKARQIVRSEAVSRSAFLQVGKQDGHRKSPENPRFAMPAFTLDPVRYGLPFRVVSLMLLPVSVSAA
jgi:hypothetical protein